MERIRSFLNDSKSQADLCYSGNFYRLGICVQFELKWIRFYKHESLSQLKLAWSFMLTEMQNTVGSVIDSGPLTSSDRAPEAVPKAMPIHRGTESLRYLLQHLTASWVSRVGVCSEDSKTPSGPQEP